MKKQTPLAKFLTRKISTNKIETSGVGALSFGDLIYDMARVDHRYVLGADFSRPSKDLSSVFKIGKQNLMDLSERGPDYLDHLHKVNYTGYTHEFVNHYWHRKMGDEVELPEKFNQKGYDAIYNGQEYQIKFGSVSNVRKARLESPTRKVDTDLETAEQYKEKFPEDTAMVFGTAPKSLTQNIVSEGKVASMEVHQDEELFEIGAPEFLGIASIISTFKNILYISDNKTDLPTGIQNVVIDSAGRATAMWGAAKLGGTFFGPIGALLAGIGGAFISQEFINDEKIKMFCQEEANKLKEDLEAYIKAAREIHEKNQDTFGNKWTKLTYNLSGYEGKQNKTDKQIKIQEELQEYLNERMRNEFEDRDKLSVKFRHIVPNEEDYGEKKGSRPPVPGMKQEYYLQPKLEGLNYKKFSEDNDIKLPEMAKEAEKIFAKVGIRNEFLPNETKALKNSVEKFIKAIQKRGI